MWEAKGGSEGDGFIALKALLQANIVFYDS